MKQKNTDTPFFSIIIPTYNRAHMISAPIKSVLRQTYQNWELIIIDDGSTDNTAEIIKGYKDERIKYFYKNNEERSVARNLGIDKSKGKYICFLDSDDYFLENHLEVHFNKISSNRGNNMVYYSGTFTEINHKRISYPHLFSSNTPVKNLWEYGYNLQPFTFHREVFNEIKMNVKLVYMEDKYFLLDILKRYDITPIHDYTNVVVEHKERSINRRFRKDILLQGKMNIFSIDSIINDHISFLKKFMPLNEIINKRKETIGYFIKASIKNLNPVSLVYFIYKYFKYKAPK